MLAGCRSRLTLLAGWQPDASHSDGSGRLVSASGRVTGGGAVSWQDDSTGAGEGSAIASGNRAVGPPQPRAYCWVRGG